MRLRQCAWLIATALLCLPASSRAQNVSDEPAPPHLAFVEGTATITREGERDTADPGMPVVPGDVLRTDRGRLEIMFPDGSALDLDEYSTFELLSSSRYRLSEGRLRLTLTGVNNPSEAARLVIDTPLAAAEMIGPGEFRLALSGTPSGMQATLDVLRGGARLSNDRGTTPLRAGEQSIAYDAAPPTYPRTFNAARVDAFDQWSASLRDERLGRQSAQYLPSDLRMYGGVLDRNGSWQYESDYGYVWYPSVAVDWRPYDDGYWSSVPVYGWTWIGVGPWSWPTHHYGRWGYHRSRWFWIPDRRWAPAWVSWGTAPGYVSWCPLGYDNRPVFALSVGIGGYWGGGGWTVVGRQHFGGSHSNVRHYAVRSLPRSTPFVQHAGAPLPPQRGSNTRRIAGGTPAGRNDPSAASNGFAVPRTTPRTGPTSGFPDRAGDRGAMQRDGRGDMTPAREPQVAGDQGRVPARDGRPPASNRPELRSGSVAVPRTAPRDNAPSVIYSTPTPSQREGRTGGRWTQPGAPAQPSGSWTPPEPFNPGARQRGNEPPPTSLTPAPPVEPVNSAARPRRGSGAAAPPSASGTSPAPTAPSAPSRAERGRNGASAPPPSAPATSESRAEPRSGARADRPARESSSGGGRESQGGGNGGGRAQARRR